MWLRQEIQALPRPDLIARPGAFLVLAPQVQQLQELWVVAGLVFDADGRVLIAQRPTGKALAGRWEFPGGKVAADETAHAAIVRELREEIGIEAGDAERLMYYAAVYPERTIWLDVWVIRDWSGQPRGLDAQSLEWVEPSRLREHDILEADAPIVAALSRR